VVANAKSPKVVAAKFQIAGFQAQMAMVQICSPFCCRIAKKCSDCEEYQQQILVELFFL
jgi:hypothetical protein